MSDGHEFYTNFAKYITYLSKKKDLKIKIKKKFFFTFFCEKLNCFMKTLLIYTITLLMFS